MCSRSSLGSRWTTTQSIRRRSRHWSASRRRRTAASGRAGRGSQYGPGSRLRRRMSGCSSGSRARASRSRSKHTITLTLPSPLEGEGMGRVTKEECMPEVYNWQLGRKMLYPYEERHPKWQFTFAFNINRCIACQTCSMADKSTWLFSKGQEYMWWNNVETKPYGGYPQFYDVKVAQLVEQVKPGGQVWNTRVGRKHHARYGVFEGFRIFGAGAKIGQA